MRKFIGFGYAALLGLALIATGCKSNNTASGTNGTTANAPMQQTANTSGACPAGQELQSDGTCTGGASQPAAAPAVANQPAQEPIGAGAPPATQENAPAAPAETAAAPAPGIADLPAGTRLHVRIGQTISTRDATDGQAFTGTVTRSVSLRGAVVIPAGARVSGVVVDSKSPGKFKGEGFISIRVTSVAGQPFRTSAYSVSVKGKGKRTAGFIGGGAAGGAILGGLFGGGKGAAIGALAGGGAGTVGAAATGNKEAEIPAETVVSFSKLRK